MKKKWLSIALVLCMVLTMLPVSAFAADVTSSGTFGTDNALTWSLYDDGTLEISGTGAMPDFSYSVPAPWKDFSSKLTKVIVNQGVTNVGESTFSYNSTIQSVVLSDTVVSVGKSAFSGCSALKTVQFGSGLTELGGLGSWNFAFGSCSSLERFEVAESNHAFSADNGILYNAEKTQIILCPQKMSGSVVIPEGVTAIGADAFDNCASITCIKLPASLTKIEGIGSSWGYAFGDCKSLEKYEVAEGNTAYAAVDGLLYSADKTQLYACPPQYAGTVDIAEGVTSIGSSVFSQCAGVTAVRFPSTLTDSLSSYTFSSCKALARFEVAAGNAVYTAKDGILYDAQMTKIILCPNQISGEIIIPDTVTQIGSSVFSGRTGITAVTLPAALTSIGSSAFNGCTSLAEITIPDGVVKLDSRAFYGCSSLTELQIPDSVTSIGSSAFYGCTGLQTVSLPQSLQELPASAFQKCTSLKTISLPKTLTKIGYSAFSNCTALTDITIPENIKTIDSNTFDGCTYLTNVTLPDGLNKIGYGAFLNCARMEQITIPSTVGEIGDSAFFGCAALRDITLPQKLQKIPKELFYGCTSLETLTIPDTVTAIGKQAFYNCTALKSVMLPATVTLVGEKAFDGCAALTAIEVSDDNTYYASDNGILYTLESGQKAELVVCPRALSGVVAIPATVHTIMDGAFQNCVYITRVIVPDSVSNIADTAFVGCQNLQSIDVGENNTVYSSPDGILLTDNGTKLICYPAGRLETSYTIPDSVTSIVASAFASSRRLLSLTFGKGMTELPKEVCKNCVSICEVTLPEGITAIGNAAFSGCSGLKQVNLPSTLAKINSSAFYKCSSLRSITIPENVEAISDYTFAYCSALEHVELSAGTKTVSDSAFNGCSSLKEIVFPETMAEYGLGNTKTFQDCASLTFFEVPSGVVRIPAAGFQNCKSLKGLVLPSSVKEIYANTFDGCDALTDIWFAGTEEQWHQITVSDWESNAALRTATIHYQHSHSFTDHVTAPNCISGGYTTHACECGKVEILNVTQPDPDAHTYGGWTVIQPAACGTAGAEKRVCTVCGAEETREIAALEHVFGAWKTTTAADCETAGKETRSCTLCGVEEQREIPVLSCPSEAYQDLSTSAWYHKSVDNMIRSGYMVGVGAGRFAPDMELSRAMFVTILYQMAGEQPTETETAFTDVSADAWYAPAVAWAFANGIVSGTSETTFSPNVPATREQIVTILMRYSGAAEPETDVLGGFQDASAVSDFALPAMNWAVANGIISGRGNGMLSPKDSATRAECCQIIAVFSAK